MPDTQDLSTTRLSGRPQSINPESVARTALELFAKHGYGAVSMAQIAEEAGIGRKSLYRYFASKADLVWGGLLEAAEISEQALDVAQGSDMRLLDAMHEAIQAALRSLPDLEVTRGRLRLIAEQPELLAQAPLRMAPQNGRMLQHLVDGGLGVDEAHYLSVAFGSVTFSAWIRWAQSNELSPAQFLTNAMKVLRLP
ncbi:TetR family transcriptional regulator [Arthrobacter sp. MYb224]|uniref:TetR family transcriptional regulator n=1 Tax=Arthrobacter sp. MYb224 TaxID=1848600 RepID=UPI000CFB7555|nr:TetR family transcriptional regulator [Arthrobacter sp. MYb224]PQZ97568.1 TetR family transcriptional regulator [Arthrobacter sp. MYb224]